MPGMSVIIGAAYDVPLTLGKVIASGRVLSGDVLAADTRVVSTALAVEIIPRPYRLAFDVATVSVVAGGAAQVGLTLTGDTELIGENETFAVEFSYDLDGGVEVVALEPMEFSAGTTTATVTLEAATTATRGTLTASVGRCRRRDGRTGDAAGGDRPAAIQVVAVARRSRSARAVQHDEAPGWWRWNFRYTRYDQCGRGYRGLVVGGAVQDQRRSVAPAPVGYVDVASSRGRGGVAVRGDAQLC